MLIFCWLLPLYVKIDAATFKVNMTKRDKVSKNGLGKICGRQPLKSFLSNIICLKRQYTSYKFYKAVFHKCYLVHSWIHCFKLWKKLRKKQFYPLKRQFHKMVKHTKIISNLLTNCLSVFDHFARLVLKGLTTIDNWNLGAQYLCGRKRIHILFKKKDVSKCLNRLFHYLFSNIWFHHQINGSTKIL